MLKIDKPEFTALKGRAEQGSQEASNFILIIDQLLNRFGIDVQLKSGVKLQRDVKWHRQSAFVLEDSVVGEDD